MSSPSYQTHVSMEEILGQYDGFILDQFGVLHNGKHGLEGAPECVQYLHEMGKKLIILSNSSSPSAAALKKLPKLGYDASHFVGAVTSGEETIKYVAETYPGKKAIFFTWDTKTANTQKDFLKRCGDIQVTGNVGDADFLLLHGVQVMRESTNTTSSGDSNDDSDNVHETSLGEYMETGDMAAVIDPILKECAERNLPMVCANPDFTVMLADGKAAYMPGKIAKRYEALGGSCTRFGKPHTHHFEACTRELNMTKDKVVHVGDSLHHDIAGANAAGIASVFVVGGIHREELGADLGDMPANKSLEELFTKHKQTPTHVVPMFKL